MILLKKASVRITPQIQLASEAVHLGEIEAREAFVDLLLDAEILVDDAELKSISQLEPVKQALSAVTAPEGPTYKTGDWRAKGSEMRTAQWKQKPVIDYIASTHKNAILQAILEKFASLPGDWRQSIMEKPTYWLETKGLQLSPTEDKKWKRVFVQVKLDLGSYEDGTGFLGKLSKEFEQAIMNGQIQESGENVIWKSSLTGLETVFKKFDPHSGAKSASHQIHGHDVARWGEGPDEADPGYDLHIKEGLMDQIQSALDDKLVEGLNADLQSLKSISDDGTFVFKVIPPGPASEQDDIAGDIEEPLA